MKRKVTWRSVVASVWLASCLAGCGSSRGIGGGTASGSGSRAASREPDPCSLLDPNEVQSVIGPLAGPPFRTREASDDNEPFDTGDACVYEATDFSSIKLAVTWKDGAMA